MFVDSFYTPILWFAAEGPSWFQNSVQWWGSLGVPDDKYVDLIIDFDDRTEVFEFPETAETSE
jgi:hypothetical protein